MRYIPMRCQRTVAPSGFGAGAMSMKQELAIYGRVYVVRGRCSACKRIAFIIDSEFQCCGRKVRVNPTSVRRVCEAPNEHSRQPGLRVQHRILASQNYLCLYCDISLLGTVVYRGKLRRVKVTWDHIVPLCLFRKQRE